MKSIFVFMFVLVYSFTSNAQNEVIEASIDNSCNAKPAQLNIASGKAAQSFNIASLISGNNCYSGAKFTDKGFVIKNSSSDLVFRYQINEDGQIYEPNGRLKDFKLNSGIYYLYVDGGKGAYVKLRFNII